MNEHLPKSQTKTTITHLGDVTVSTEVEGRVGRSAYEPIAHSSWEQTQGLHRKSGGKMWRTTGWNPKHPGVFKRLVASGGDENPELHKPNENCLHASNIKHPWKKPWVPDASCQGASTMISASPGFSRDVLFSNTVVSKLPCSVFV